MKHVLLLCLFFVGIYKSQAQVTLLYETNFKSLASFPTSSGLKYYYFDESEKQLVLFNQDMSVYKKVGLDIERASFLFLSDKLFNTDPLIEFIVAVYLSEGYKTVLYNENGEVLHDFGDRWISDIHQVNGKYRIIAARSTLQGDINSDIYELPGEPVTNTNARVLPASSNPAYPNPSTTIVNLPYKLELGSSSLMSIYSAGGSLIDQKQLDANIDRIMLDVSNYQPGVYMYEYNGITNRFVVK